MARTLIVAILLFGLPGCSTLPDWALFGAGAGGLKKESGSYDFAWRLSGSRAVAPVQVFDNGRRMWLQFASGQALPAIFLRSHRGERPLDYRREGPYVVLPGVWPHLVLRGGHLESFIDRIDPVPGQPRVPGSSAANPASGNSPAVSFAAPDTHHAVDAVASSVGDKASLPPRSPVARSVRSATSRPTSSTPSAGATARARPKPVAPKVAALSVSDPMPTNVAMPASQKKDPGTPLVGTKPADAAFTADSFVATPVGSGSMAKPVPAQAARPTHATAYAKDGKPKTVPTALRQQEQSAADQAGLYEVGPTDGNIRLALTRWAQAAGWTFKAEHWAVDADIPIVGSARFESGFQLAVQDLVASTELADRPLQPCFYSNKVLRIVPYAQSCDRTVGGAQSS